MATELAAKRSAFRALHQSGCFVLPNPWDVGSAVRLERMGFKALASTSSGAAWAMGREDGELLRDEVLSHLYELCAATDLPVNADFEAGFADSAWGVRENVALAIKTGVAGLSIEDRVGSDLYDLEFATERIQAARDAIVRSDEDVLLVARSEGFLIGQTDLNATIRRLVAYAEAGADCLYAPGIRDVAAIREVVAAVAPKPVNVLLLGARDARFGVSPSRSSTSERRRWTSGSRVEGLRASGPDADGRRPDTSAWLKRRSYLLLRFNLRFQSVIW